MGEQQAPRRRVRSVASIRSAWSASDARLLGKHAAIAATQPWKAAYTQLAKVQCAAAHARCVARAAAELPGVVEAPGVRATLARQADGMVAPRRDGREAQPAGARARHLQRTAICCAEADE